MKRRIILAFSVSTKSAIVLLVVIWSLAILSLASCHTTPQAIVSVATMIPISSVSITQTFTIVPALTLTPRLRIPTATAAFVHTKNLAEATPLSAADALAKWLKGIPCAPPCWEGVTPGKTTVLEAVKLWNANPLFRKVTTNSSLQFEMNVSPPDYFIGEVYFYSTKPIDGIRLDAFEKVRLSDLIQAFGPPTHIIADIRPTRQASSINEWYLNIIWVSKGFSVADVRSEIPHPEINENTSLSSGNYFPPGLDSFRKTGMDIDRNGNQYVLVPWHGYDSFDSYAALTATLKK